MSKRAEKASLKTYPKEKGKMWASAFGIVEFDRNAVERKGFQEGYEQAEKDTIERACEYLFKHYAVNIDEFKKAMEEE